MSTRQQLAQVLDTCFGEPLSSYRNTLRGNLKILANRIRRLAIIFAVGYSILAAVYLVTSAVDPIRSVVALGVGVFTGFGAGAWLTNRMAKSRLGTKQTSVDTESRKPEPPSISIAPRQPSDDFLSMLAHELRTPLSSLRMSLQVITAEEVSAETIASMVPMMERQLDQLTTLADNVLDMSRITRGIIQLHKKPIALSSLVNSVVDTYRPIFQHGQREFTVTVPDAPLVANVDKDRLTQVLSSLLSNALKYTDQQGHIWISLEREAGDALLRVRDSGVGIEPSLLPSVFNASRSIERSKGGLEFGLTVVKQVVDVHGGSIVVQSEGIGKGSEFIVRLPIEPTPTR
jgi:signal transduction histidine kinase